MKPHQKAARLARKNRQARKHLHSKAVFADLGWKSEHFGDGKPEGGGKTETVNSHSLNLLVSGSGGRSILGGNRFGMSVSMAERLARPGATELKEAQDFALGASQIPPSFTPAWEPLEKLLGDHRVGDFMFMASYPRDCGGHIYAYKHRETRRYLHLDADGRCYQQGSKGYEEIPAVEALERAFS